VTFTSISIYPHRFEEILPPPFSFDSKKKYSKEIVVEELKEVLVNYNSMHDS
jgi:hypothetical protein